MEGIILSKDQFKVFNEGDQFMVFQNNIEFICKSISDEELCLFDFDEYKDQLTELLFIDYIHITSDDKLYGFRLGHYEFIKDVEGAFEYVMETVESKS